MKKILMLIVSVLFFNSLYTMGQNIYLSKAEVTNDIDSLEYIIRIAHVDPFAKYMEEDFSRDIKELKENLPDSLTILDFFKQITPIVTRIGDGHTQMQFPARVMSENTLLFPIAVKIDQNDSIFHVVQDFEDNGVIIPKGSKITAINNIPYKEMLEYMLEFCSGERTFFRIAKINYLFPQTFHLLYPYNEFKIDYTFGGRDNKVTVNAKRMADLKLENPISKIFSNPYSLSIDEEKNTAIIEFNTFWNKARFNTFIDSTFNVVKQKGIKNLVIDIRNNGGGDSRIGDIFLKYITNKPYNQFSKAVTKVSPLSRKFGNWKKDQEDGVYIEDDFGLIEPEDNPLRFTGNIYLLISHTTFSSAASFSWIFQQLQLGTIIGEETGGMAVTPGNIIPYQLTNSKIDLVISFTKFYQFNANEKNIHGTIPDILIPADNALNFVLNEMIN